MKSAGLILRKIRFALLLGERSAKSDTAFSAQPSSYPTFQARYAPQYLQRYGAVLRLFYSISIDVAQRRWQ